jgi:hypothetical protein
VSRLLAHVHAGWNQYTIENIYFMVKEVTRSVILKSPPTLSAYLCIAITARDTAQQNQGSWTCVPPFGSLYESLVTCRISRDDPLPRGGCRS